jgi:hypothetical protein
MAEVEAEVEAEIKTAISRQIETVANETANMQKWFDLEPTRAGGTPQRSPPGGPTYESLGLRPLINCKGTYTIISGSLMLPEVREAMANASQQYVQMEELQFAAGQRISELMQAEWALVTCGCSAALLQLTAACMSGTDPELMCLLPDTSHPRIKNEVLVQRDQRDDYDAAVRMTGAKIIEYSSRAELEAKIGPRTALLLALGDADSGGLGIGGTHEEITPAEVRPPLPAGLAASWCCPVLLRTPHLRRALDPTARGAWHLTHRMWRALTDGGGRPCPRHPSDRRCRGGAPRRPQPLPGARRRRRLLLRRQVYAWAADCRHDARQEEPAPVSLPQRRPAPHPRPPCQGRQGRDHGARRRC